MYSGARQDSGLNPLQQHVLNVISSCMQEQGINIKEVVDTLTQQGHSDPSVRWVGLMFSGWGKEVVDMLTQQS